MSEDGATTQRIGHEVGIVGLCPAAVYAGGIGWQVATGAGGNGDAVG